MSRETVVGEEPHPYELGSEIELVGDTDEGCWVWWDHYQISPTYLVTVVGPTEVFVTFTVDGPSDAGVADAAVDASPLPGVDGGSPDA